MPAGRPTKYKPEFCAKAQEYLDTCTDEREQLIKRISDTAESYEYRQKVKLPTIESFARFIGVNKTTIFEWASKYPEFSNSLDLIVKEQRQRLIDKGLAGEYNSTIAKLILSANHGMREGVDLTSNGSELKTTVIYMPKEDED